MQKKSNYEKILDIFKLDAILESKITAIHAHFGDIANEFIFIKKLVPGIKFFVTFHGYDIRAALSKNDFFYKNLFTLADGVISICDYNSNRLREIGCPKEKIFRVNNGVNLNFFAKKEVAGFFDLKDEIIILTVARLEPEKNLIFAICLIDKLARNFSHKKIKYLIVGDGSLRSELEAKVDELNLQGTVFLLGAKSKMEVRGLLEKADIFLLTSTQEASPIVILEAMAAKVAVAASSVGGIPEMIKDGETGILLNLSEVEFSFQKLYLLMIDQKLRFKIVEKAYQYVSEQHNMDFIINKLIKIYSNANKQCINCGDLENFRIDYKS